jgi:crossover junction endodeoxyribonuclease RuvC
MKILGIDPGYERIGIAIIDKNKGEKERLIFSECFKTSKEINFEERILLIGKKIEEIIKEHKPEILAIETLFLNTNQKTVMHVSEARGVIIYEAMKNNLGLFEATPPQIKIATTGYGRADKKDVLKMVRLLIDIDESKKSDDELDAIAIALTAYAHLKY